jgi:hypothetical protein
MLCDGSHALVDHKAHVQGLEDAIGLSVVHPTWQKTRPDKDEHAGWTFASQEDPPFTNLNGFGSFPPTDCIPDTVNHAKFIRDLYEMTGQDPGVRFLRDGSRRCCQMSPCSMLFKETKSYHISLLPDMAVANVVALE